MRKKSGWPIAVRPAAHYEVTDSIAIIGRGGDGIWQKNAAGSPFLLTEGQPYFGALNMYKESKVSKLRFRQEISSVYVHFPTFANAFAEQKLSAVGIIVRAFGAWHLRG
jgi:hypothetical protein